MCCGGEPAASHRRNALPLLLGSGMFANGGTDVDVAAWRARRAAEFARARVRHDMSNNSVSRAHELLRSKLLRDLQVGEQLVESDLMSQLSASRTTVRKVLRHMADEGLITRAPKIGTLVQRPSFHVNADLRALWSDSTAGRPHLGGVQVKVLVPPPIVRGRLAVGDDRPVALLEGKIIADDVTVGLMFAYLAIDFMNLDTSSGTDSADLGVPPYMVQLAANLADAQASITVAAMPCDAETATTLKVVEGSPILWIENDFVDEQGRCRAVVKTRCMGTLVTVAPQV